MTQGSVVSQAQARAQSQTQTQMQTQTQATQGGTKRGRRESVEPVRRNHKQ